MIAAIRISGLVDVPESTEQALYRLRLRRKYSMVLVKPTPQNLSILKKVRNHVAYGSIDSETLKELIEKRAVPIDRKTKIDSGKILEGIEKKELVLLGIKPFFRLHPPRGGIDSKLHFGITKKAVLGNNKEDINALIRRML